MFGLGNVTFFHMRANLGGVMNVRHAGITARFIVSEKVLKSRFEIGKFTPRLLILHLDC